MKPPWHTAKEADHTFTVVRVGAADEVVAVVPHTVPYEQRQGVAHLLAGSPELFIAAQDLIERHDKKWKSRCLCEDCLALLHALDKCKGKRPV